MVSELYRLEAWMEDQDFEGMDLYDVDEWMSEHVKAWDKIPSQHRKDLLTDWQNFTNVEVVDKWIHPKPKLEEIPTMKETHIDETREIREERVSIGKRVKNVLKRFLGKWF